MHLSAKDLRTFYYRTRLGRAAQAALRSAVRELWPDVKGMNIGGFGFAGPFLRPLRTHAARVVNLMPAQQGAAQWPPEGPNVSVLVDERNWPVNAGFFDRILVAHGLETSERAAALMEEVNRCLAPGGRAIFMVPNRSGLWARGDATPFGYGRPYSLGQLEQHLAAHGFVTEQETAALYAVPSHREFWLRLAPLAERTGRRWLPDRMAGVLMVDAQKRAFAAPRGNAPQHARRPLEALEGLTTARPKAVSLAPGNRAGY